MVLGCVFVCMHMCVSLRELFAYLFGYASLYLGLTPALYSGVTPSKSWETICRTYMKSISGSVKWKASSLSPILSFWSYKMCIFKDIDGILNNRYSFCSKYLLKLTFIQTCNSKDYLYIAQNKRISRVYFHLIFFSLVPKKTLK